MMLFVPQDHATQLAKRLLKLKRNGAAVSVDFAELGIKPAIKGCPFPTLLLEQETVVNFAKQLAKAARERDLQHGLVSCYIGPDTEPNKINGANKRLVKARAASKHQ
jgi:hypothetical protein